MLILGGGRTPSRPPSTEAATKEAQLLSVPQSLEANYGPCFRWCSGL